MEIKTYKTASAFRTALETRLLNVSKIEKIDLQKLRRQVAFERLLARLFSHWRYLWILKGGYAMQLRTQNSRVTRDIDLSIQDPKLISDKPEEQNNAIYLILKTAIATDLGDFFTFDVSDPVMELEAAPYGGARFLMTVKLDGRIFEKFHLDVGIGDEWIDPLELLEPKSLLEFAGISSSPYPSISKEQQFAEKVHAYSLPRGEGITNSRVKDLIDLVLLISAGGLDKEKLITSLQKTFARRGTHSLAYNLTEPPKVWMAPFDVLAKETDIGMNVDQAFELVAKFVRSLAP